MLRAALGGIFGGKPGVLATMRANPEDYAELERLVKGGVKVVIEQTFPLSRAALAFAVCEGGKVRGKVVITPGVMGSSSQPNPAGGAQRCLRVSPGASDGSRHATAQARRCLG
jgi:hypothetical protein